MKKIARINSTPQVIQACLCTIRSILQVTQRVPPTCIIKTDFTYIGAGVWCGLFGERVLWHAPCRVGTTVLSLPPPGNVEH